VLVGIGAQNRRELTFGPTANNDFDRSKGERVSSAVQGSLPEVHSSVAIPPTFWRRLFAFAGPAYMVSVGYMDPGNWATDIEGGSRFGYQLVWVLLMSNLIAVLLQTLCARLGIVAGRDLAQACRDSYPRPVSHALWILCEIAIAACDLAEVLGTAIGLNLLFGVSLMTGVIVTALDVFVLLAIQRFGIRKMEGFILLLVATIGGCFVFEVLLAQPVWGDVVKGFVPRLGSTEALYVAIGILGATVMPHNLYLHSALVQTRQVPRTTEGMRTAARYNLIDSAVALNCAFFVNAAILILSAAVFHARGIEVTEIQQAHGLLVPLLGTGLAGAAFAIALLCAGQSSTLTGTLAGQVVMEGFLRFRMRPWLRRLLTRSVAIVPAVVVIGIYGEQGTYKLLILSQVILSLQLPFAVIPLIQFTSDKARMGSFASPLVVRVLAWISAAIIVGLNAKLVVDTASEWIASAANPWPLRLTLLPAIGATALLLLYVVAHPWLTRRARPAVPAAGEAATVPVPPERGFRRIAIALGADAKDAVLLEHGLSLARSYGSSVVFVHVADGFGPRYFGGESNDLETRDDREYLEGARRRAEAAGLTAETELLFGDPVHQIAAFVERSGADLLVMGAHGHGPIADLLFGSTVNPVRHRVKIPVFVVRADARD
jgi:manganese transport protein